MGLSEIRMALLALTLSAFGLPTAPAVAQPANQLSNYTYESTKRLVSLVEDAATLMENQGTAAFQQFAVNGSRWFNGNDYLFVYAPDGTCVFHPVSPELVGKNLINLRDMNGKPVIQRIVDIAKQPGNDASAWIFYLWEDKVQLTPDWKSAFVRKVVTPDNKVYLIGAGIYSIRVEKIFVQWRVDDAVALLKAEGREAAFQAFRDPAERFYFLDTYIFVLDSTGHTVVDPAYPTLVGRDLLQFQDAVGALVIRDLLQRLKVTDAAWVQYLWPAPGDPMPSRKLIYARRVTVGGEVLIVGSDFYLATPIWLKVEDERQWPASPPA
jgi:signal transduction histidine kinase